MNKPWFLYITQSRSGKYYVGITVDVEKRIEAHNDGRGSVMGRIDGPLTLQYTSLPLANQSVARTLEIQIKKWPRNKKQQLITGLLTIEV